MKVQEFLLDNGNVRIRGFKMAEIRKNGYAVIAIACDYQDGGCHALHIHLVTEDEKGELTLITSFDSTNDEAIARSGFLFRALVMVVHGVLDSELVMPVEDEEEESCKKEGGFTEVIPGLTPWGKS